MTTIHLGYEVGTGRAVEVPLNHTAVTGQTQRSGKTTTLEALAARSGGRAVTFVTKRFERSFAGAPRVAPYFRQRADWQFVASILEATMREKFRYERPWIVRVTKGAKTLQEVHDNIRRAMKKSREGGRNHDVYLMLNEYLDIVVPALARVRWAAGLELRPGLNVMDLSAMPAELHGLVIGSAIEWVYERERDTVVVIPEAWEFLPQARSSPVRLACEHLIRKGAGGGNYVWLDSQDLAAVDVAIRKSVIVWLLGVQREQNEVKRVLGYIVGACKPKAEDIMTLDRGQFWACWGDQAVKVYVQPAWMGDAVACRVAMGERVTVTPPAPPPASEPPTPTELPMPDNDAVLAKLGELMDLMRSGHLAARPAPAVAAATPNHAPAVAVPDEEALYQRFKARLLAELPQEPAVMQVLAQRPELRVGVERPVIEADGRSLRGRIARLIADGFFDDGVTGHAVNKELGRRGAMAPVGSLYGELDVLAELGFLFIEPAKDAKSGKRYQKAPGMVTSIVEK